MDLSLAPDFDSALLNWEDEVDISNSATSSNQSQSHTSDSSEVKERMIDTDGASNNICQNKPGAVASDNEGCDDNSKTTVQLASEVGVGIEEKQSLSPSNSERDNSTSTSIEATRTATAVKDTSSIAMGEPPFTASISGNNTGTANSISVQVGQQQPNTHTATTSRSNVPLLNGFVTALADQSALTYEKSPANNHVSHAVLPFLKGVPISGNPAGSGQQLQINSSTSSSHNLNQPRIPQHLILQGKVGLENVSKSNNNSSQEGENTGYRHIEPIFPPNYFLSGMLPWEPSPATATAPLLPSGNDQHGSKAANNVGESGIQIGNMDSRRETTASCDSINSDVSSNSAHNATGSKTPSSGISMHNAVFPNSQDQKQQQHQVPQNIVHGRQVYLQTYGAPQQEQQQQPIPSTIDNSVDLTGRDGNIAVPFSIVNPSSGATGAKDGAPNVMSMYNIMQALQKQGTPVNTSSGQMQSAAVVRGAETKTSNNNEKNSKAPTKKSKRQQKDKKQSQHNDNMPPPFYLFDAPCELRTNFLHSQRLNNLPTVPDANAYHYGMAVNGFHPQLNAQVNPAMPLVGLGTGGTAGSPTLPNGMPLQLVDGRHRGKSGRGSMRNEREQQRAQKITELIEKLRLSMVQGGWKVEMKSKYHTLSTCADYVKHLIKITKEKEAAVEKAKSDLTVKERKLEEEKALQESRSDPESVTSSLTASSSGSGSGLSSERDQESSGSAGFSTKSDQGDISDTSKKRKEHSMTNEDENVDGAYTCKHPVHKKIHVNDDGRSFGSGPAGNNVSLDKMSSSVSDMTESKNGSSRGTGDGSDAKCSSEYTNSTNANEPSSSSISSTAAVASGVGSQDKGHQHSDVIIKESVGSRERKRKHKKYLPSIHHGFELNYEEVFLTSNVPQLIATTAGRIVTCNKFFLRVTGLSELEVRRLTIFSIVQADKLSNLFELVAGAIRKSSKYSSRSPNFVSGDVKKKLWDYDAVTLPCIPFPNDCVIDDKPRDPIPLFMTVLLMFDDNPKKRCLHCILTDVPGTNGAVGSVTPELLSMLFSKHRFGHRFDEKCEDKSNSIDLEGRSKKNKESRDAQAGDDDSKSTSENNEAMGVSF